MRKQTNTKDKEPKKNKYTLKYVALDSNEIPDWLCAALHNVKHPELCSFRLPKRVKVLLIFWYYLVIKSANEDNKTRY